MWFLNEPLWVFRRKVGRIPLQEVSMNVGSHDVNSEGNSMLSYRKYTMWTLPSSIAIALQSLSMYIFLWAVIVYYLTLKDMLDMSHFHMTLAVGSCFLSQYLASAIWNNFSISCLSVRTIAFLASAISTASTYAYLQMPERTYFFVMVVLHGFMNGFITGPTQSIVAHYYQSAYVCTAPFMHCGHVLTMGSVPFIMASFNHDPTLHDLFEVLCWFELVSCVLNLLLLPRATVSKREVSSQRLDEIFTEAASYEPIFPTTDNDDDDEAETDEPPRVTGFRNTFIMPALRGFLNQVKKTKASWADTGVVVDSSVLIGRRRLNAFQRWMRIQKIVVFKAPCNDAWILTFPRVRWAVLGQSCLQAGMIFLIFLPSLVESCKFDIDSLSPLIGLFMFGCYIGTCLIMKMTVFRGVCYANTVFWLTSFGMCALCWNAEIFRDQWNQLGLSFAIGLLLMSTFVLSVHHLSEFYEGQCLASAMEARLFLGTVVFTVMLVAQGLILDYTGDFFKVYSWMAGFVGLSAVPLFLIWLLDTLRWIAGLLFPNTDVPNCCGRNDDEDEDQTRPLKEFYVAI